MPNLLTSIQARLKYLPDLYVKSGQTVTLTSKAEYNRIIVESGGIITSSGTVNTEIFCREMLVKGTITTGLNMVKIVCANTLTVNAGATINADGKGFAGGAGGAAYGASALDGNDGIGPGGGKKGLKSNWAGQGGGGSHLTAGTAGSASDAGKSGTFGSTYTEIANYLGSGGGGGAGTTWTGSNSSDGFGGAGGDGGGLLYVYCGSLVNNGTISAKGKDGNPPPRGGGPAGGSPSGLAGAGGAGSGGAVLLFYKTSMTGSGTVSVAGGAGILPFGPTQGYPYYSGNGGNGYSLTQQITL